jgi:hypothetical protein
MRKKTDERRRGPEPEPGVLPGAPEVPDRGPGILPGTPAEKRKDDLSQGSE